MSKEQKLLTAQALAEALDLAVETVWRYTREKRIPFIELGARQYRYVLEEVVAALTGSSVVGEESAQYQACPEKKYTYQDYLKIPWEQGARYELLEGLLVKEPAPNVSHSRVSRRLLQILEEYFLKTDPGSEIFASPVDVTLGDINVVQPDLFYIASEQSSMVEHARVNGAPQLAVEVISPSSGRKDRIQKLQIYQKAGIQHYWLVNPAEKTLECFVLQNGVYALVIVGVDEEVVEHPSFPRLSIDLKFLFRQGPAV